MSDAAFIAYVCKDDPDLPLKENTHACLVYTTGHPAYAGAVLYELLHKRILGDLHESCRILVDEARANNGWDTLSWRWYEDVIAGEKANWPCHPRYGLEALHGKRFHFHETFKQAYRVVYDAVNSRDPYNLLIHDHDGNMLPYAPTVFNFPQYSDWQHPLDFVDPFRVRSYDEKQYLVPEKLWMYLIDPFNEKLHIFKGIHVTPVMEWGYFNQSIDFEIEYFHFRDHYDLSTKTPYNKNYLDNWREGARGNFNQTVEFLRSELEHVEQPAFARGGPVARNIQYRVNWDNMAPRERQSENGLTLPPPSAYLSSEAIVDVQEDPAPLYGWNGPMIIDDCHLDETQDRVYQSLQQVTDWYQSVLSSSRAASFTFAMNPRTWSGIADLIENGYARSEEEE